MSTNDCLAADAPPELTLDERMNALQSNSTAVHMDDTPAEDFVLKTGGDVDTVCTTRFDASVNRLAWTVGSEDPRLALTSAGNVIDPRVADVVTRVRLALPDGGWALVCLFVCWGVCVACGVDGVPVGAGV